MARDTQGVVTLQKRIDEIAEEDAKKQNPPMSKAAYVSNLILNNRHKMLRRKVYLAHEEV